MTTRMSAHGINRSSIRNSRRQGVYIDPSIQSITYDLTGNLESPRAEALTPPSQNAPVAVCEDPDSDTNKIRRSRSRARQSAFLAKRPVSDAGDVPNFSRPLRHSCSPSVYESAISTFKDLGFGCSVKEDERIRIGPTGMDTPWPYVFKVREV